MNSFTLFLFLKAWRHSERFRVFAADAAMRVLSGGFSHRSRRPRRLSLSRCPRARLVQQSGRTDPSLTDNEPQSQACQFVCLTIHTGLPLVTRLSSSVKWDQKTSRGTSANAHPGPYLLPLATQQQILKAAVLGHSLNDLCGSF